MQQQGRDGIGSNSAAGIVHTKLVREEVLTGTVIAGTGRGARPTESEIVKLLAARERSAETSLGERWNSTTRWLIVNSAGELISRPPSGGVTTGNDNRDGTARRRHQSIARSRTERRTHAPINLLPAIIAVAHSPACAAPPSQRGR